MKRTIIISVILIACTTCFAAEPTAYVDNFVYTLDYAHHTAEVAANPKASGDIIIPEQIKDGEGNVTREQLWFTRKLGFTITLR